MKTMEKRTTTKITAGSLREQAVNIGNRLELFVDRCLIDRLENTRLTLHEPVSGGVAVKLDRDWEGPANFPLSVFHCGKQYFMYYRAMSLLPECENGMLCVAVSEDGIVWRKPDIGLVKYNGLYKNNIAADEAARSFMATPWLDTRPGVPEDEKIKAISCESVSGEKYTAYHDPQGAKRLVFWVSADGFSFRKLDPQPELISNLRNCFDGGNTMFWSEIEQQYLLYYRWYESVGDNGYRSMARTGSKDLFTWSESIPMTYGNLHREQFYTNNTQPYFRAPHIYLAPAARFMEGKRILTDSQISAIDLKMSHGAFYGNDCSDVVLLSSRAGSEHYDRTFMEVFIRPGPGMSNWVSRTNYPATGILPCDRDPNRIMLFVARNYMQSSWHIERLLLRTDGFASITAPWEGGEALSKPLIFSGRTLKINYRTSASGQVYVEIQTADGIPVSGYTIEECKEIAGDEIERTVAWKEGADLSAFAAKPIRLRFVLKDADLFGIRFS
ncbi:MAG: hypothetical protein PHV82_19320 [Victivallaceae bacterium]|nr:hypothetical protein [Victivallaceae bacterium]